MVVLGSLGFENAYALAMRRDRGRGAAASRPSTTSPPTPAELTLGADLEFLSRPEWAAVQRAYGLSFKAEHAVPADLHVPALTGGQADVISAFSSDGRIAADDLVVLADPRHALPPYDAVMLVSPEAGRRSRAARRAAAADRQRSPSSAMRAANLSVDRDTDKATPGAGGARRWRRSWGFNPPLREGE